MAEDILKAARERALRLGFAAFRVTAPERVPDAGARLRQAIADGHHATMDWLPETADRRSDPRALWPEVRSVVMLGFNYGPETDPLALLERKDRASISVYSRNRDYHDILKGRLKEVAGLIARDTGAEVKVFVDTAPVMEKPLAASAGLGWQGKHTNLVSRDYGSWLFLGAVFSAADLPLDEPERDHCGSCRACLDICPTKAFPAPYRLDARRCISYLTIEHDGPIPHEFRKAMGNRIYGCDDCLAVCPWNKFAEVAAEQKLRARADLEAPDIADLLALNETAFRVRFCGSPVKRIGRDRFIRNVLIAAGNSAMEELAEQVRQHLADPSPMVRGAAVWALARLGGPDRIEDLAGRLPPDEKDEGVRDEWRRVTGRESADEIG
ncbi:Epoxyqueuosine reductase [Hartmannibacter diazotrophicus]|uniref:Epoxyqueuosine reductase n=1 Tax=Hartmannibacter diazotrophicus TaxID=1482074 RepID=A0A2C9D0C5_9HYPH|nr:tRNA epoxyqueuosine(34) reductase QueG [Hartmannibacter diazotrophicus]SON53710.1 Epoxyqueuosine reductase [Hartmannibacter diazotrophicus]